MKKERLVKTLALAIVVLFISVSFQPIIAENTTSVEKESDNNNVDFEQVKEYLFQTLIDISNNPEVKQFLNEHKKDLFSRDNKNYDCKNAIQKICSQKPRLLKSILFTRPEMSYEYLETTYNKGLKLYDSLGYEKSSKIVESVKNITNPEFFNELKNIIKNDKELSKRISVLGEMNQELKSNPTSWGFPIICFILICCFEFQEIVLFTYLGLLDDALRYHNLLKLLFAVIIAPFFFVFVLTFAPIVNLILLFNCDIPYEPPGS